MFNSFVAKMLPSTSPSKLTVDAVPVTKNGFTGTSPSPEIAESDANRFASIDPWQSVSSEEFASPISPGVDLPANNHLMTLPSPQLISPNANHLPSYLLHNMNNSLAVKNVEVQNNYNFSQISGLHIGNVNFHQANEVSNCAPETSGTKASIAPKIQKSKSIKGKCVNNQFEKKTIFDISLQKKKNTELLDSEEPLDRKVLHILSRHMGSGWRFTLRQLGFTDAEIHHKCERFINLMNGVDEIIYQFLLEWSRNDDDATVGKLCTFLWKNRERECVCQLKNHLKIERAQKISESSSITENGVGIEIVKATTKADTASGDSEK